MSVTIATMQMPLCICYIDRLLFLWLNCLRNRMKRDPTLVAFEWYLCAFCNIFLCAVNWYFNEISFENSTQRSYSFNSLLRRFCLKYNVYSLHHFSMLLFVRVRYPDVKLCGFFHNNKRKRKQSSELSP